MTSLQELERRVAEANARVADRVAAWDKAQAVSGHHTFDRYKEIEIALAARQAALTALEEARRPRLLNVEEAREAFDADRMGSGAERMQAVLDAAYASALRVIEGLPTHCTQVGQYGDAVLLRDIRTVLRSGRNVVAEDATEGVQQREGSKS